MILASQKNTKLIAGAKEQKSGIAKLNLSLTAQIKFLSTEKQEFETQIANLETQLALIQNSDTVEELKFKIVKLER